MASASRCLQTLAFFSAGLAADLAAAISVGLPGKDSALLVFLFMPSTALSTVMGTFHGVRKIRVDSNQEFTRRDRKLHGLSALYVGELSKVVF